MTPGERGAPGIINLAAAISAVLLTLVGSPLRSVVQALPGAAGSAGVAAQDQDAVRALLITLEQGLRAGNPGAYLAAVAGAADARARDFASTEFQPGATRVVLKERSRSPIPGTTGLNDLRVVVDAFVEFGDRARAARWRLDLRKGADRTWTIAGQQRLSGIDRLDRLSITATKQFTARDFTVRAEDFDLTLADGSVFTVDTDRGVTALVLLGRGTMRFHPSPETEKGQIKIFSGSDVLESAFEAAFVHAADFSAHADLSQLVPRPVDPRDLRRATDVFREEVPKSFAVDVGDVADPTWSMVPGPVDIVAQVRTRRFGTLTYARNASAPEDISLVDRAHQKNISLYSSKDRLEARGRFYDEDETTEYDVLDYDLDLAFDPPRRWFDARARLRLRIRAATVGELTFRLADTLAVRSVTSEELGGLFTARVTGQNTVLVILPAAVQRGSELTVTFAYSGRVAGQAGDWETLLFTQRELDALAGTPDATTEGPRPEINYIYANRSYWYPRATVFDYATARLRIWVPADYQCLATGEAAPESPTLDDTDPAQRRRLFVFAADRPVRYLSLFITRLTPTERATVAFSDDAGGPGTVRGPAMGGAVYNTLNMTVLAHQPAVPKAHVLAAEAVGITQFFRSIVGDSPYSSLTLALVEGNAPGDHSPGYFTAIRRPSLGTPNVWRNDPAAFDLFAEFLPAHAIAHQWWGQAVGWKTYHDQWLSESFAQYFAALYTGHLRGDAAFRDTLRQMRKWGMDQSPQGPLFLGYRIGHVRDDGRAFRALVYDKGAAVLHMLRRLIGDDAFFLGVRRFYAGWRYEKASTEDLRHAMESESGRSLERFFERWIYGSSLPQLKYSYRVDGAAPTGPKELLVRIDQTGDLFDLPLTLVVEYSDRPPVEVVITISERTTEMRVPLAGAFRRLDISKEDATLADPKLEKFQAQPQAANH